MALSAGARIGPYEVTGSLGAGGMGEVYRARDTRLGREVAIKILSPELSNDPDRLRRFEQEARAAGVLNHPNVMMIHDVGATDGLHYVVSELLEGETLRDRLNSGPLPVSRAIEYGLQIVRGLAAAHARSIVHRDLKPENLFITGDGLVKILDFGLAKLLHDEADGDDATVALGTRPGTVWGTMGYMSPEQLRGLPTDHRTDLFAFGVVLHEMLTGRAPFHRDSSPEVMSAILRDDPPELSNSSRGVPPALDRIVRHCLEKRPEDRFQSTRDVAFALETLSGHRAIEGALEPAPKKKTTRIKPVTAARAAALPVPVYHQLTFRRGTVFSARFAPDGQSIFYDATWDGEPLEIFSTRRQLPDARALGFKHAHLFAVSESGDLAISLDCRYVNHRQFIGTLARVPIDGAAPRPLVERALEADITPDGREMAVVRDVDGRNRLEYPIGKPLYHTSGWVSHPRISPKGLVAFLDHPMQGDDRGTVATVDREGKHSTLSPVWGGEEGLAWSSDESEVWFTAAEVGLARALHGVTPSGKQRVVARVAGGLILQDVARDGRVLVVRDGERSEIMFHRTGDPRDRNLSWLDLSVVADISDDGSTLLFTEQGVVGGSTYAVCLRRTDGSPVIRLGDGSAAALSPDGSMALAILYGAEPQLEMLPTGAGETRILPRQDIADFLLARWVPDGKRIVFVGKKFGEPFRCYLQDVAGGEPRAIQSHDFGLRGAPVSPDSQRLAMVGPDRKIVIAPLEGGIPEPVAGALPGDVLIRWTGDGQGLFVYQPGEVPARIHKLSLQTGQREPWMDVLPFDPAGVSTIGQIRLTPDGTSCVYSYKRTLSELFLVQGLV